MAIARMQFEVKGFYDKLKRFDQHTDPLVRRLVAECVDLLKAIVDRHNCADWLGDGCALCQAELRKIGWPF